MTTVFDETQIFGASGQPKFDIYTPSSTQKHRLGTRYVKGDGRVYHYSSANATTALVAGDLQQSAIDGFIANEQQDLTIATASAVGDNFGYATTGTDTLTEDFMKDGWYIVSDGSAAQGVGQMYQIKSNPAGAAGSTKFTFYDNIEVLISTSAKAGLLANQYKNALQFPATTPTGMPIGVVPTVVPVSNFFWLQTWGPCNMLIKTALTPGQSVIVDLGAAGSGGISAGSEAEAVIGIAMMTCDTTDNGLVYLQIAP